LIVYLPFTFKKKYLKNLTFCINLSQKFLWNWENISRNPNLTMGFIEKNIDKISFKKLSRNRFTFENIRIKKKEEYILLERERSFHKLMNLYVIKQYM